jgi:hypothetical protein
MSLASVDLGLLSFAFTAVIGTRWAFETKKSNDRIGKLEAAVAEPQSNVSGLK